MADQPRGPVRRSLAAVAATLAAATAADAQAPALPFAFVPGADAQPGGPSYDFRIGKHEVTNSEYSHFLNDALGSARGLPDGTPDARSDYMYFDTDSGNVYIHDRQSADEGTVAPTSTINIRLYDSGVGRIAFVAERFEAEAGFEDHPVVGVSWFGAVKFCNWLTIAQGMTDPDERVYGEGPTFGDWGPLEQGAELLALRGFRLVRDGTSGAAHADNEWYKAGAWNQGLGANAVFGFGRNELTNRAANFRDSGDPFEFGTSPVGFFDGVNELDDGTPTEDTSNPYGVHDMTGNVAEWIHDAAGGGAVRAIRGGHYANPIGSDFLRNDVRDAVHAGSTLSFVGFRVAQVVDVADLEVSPVEVRVHGYVGGPYMPDGLVVEVRNPRAQAVDSLLLTVDPPYLEADTEELDVIPPGAIALVPLTVAEGASHALIAPGPPGDFVPVAGNDVQVGGPDYDYWIGRNEVTNAEYAAFLNDALANAGSANHGVRSQYMYFDTDSGSVYIHTQHDPEIGTDAPSATLTTVLYDAAVGRIYYSENSFRIRQGHEDHPVVGVTWFGALKYCNWRSIEHGIPSSLRAYTEGPSSNLGSWRPVVVDEETWLSEGMTDELRGQFIEETLGYRLPMDGGTGAADPGRFNEWYKAASRRALDAEEAPAFGAMYGFGRDGPLTGSDANYAFSGDSENEGTTPVGFFDGVHALYQEESDCYPPPQQAASTVDTANGYGLYDASGNVSEWMQDRGGDASDRGVRGGSWRNDADSPLLTTTGRASLPAAAASDDTGFRVARGTGHVVSVTAHDNSIGAEYSACFVLDLQEPCDVEPRTGLTVSVPYGSVDAQQLGEYRLTNRSASEMDWEVAVDAHWVDAHEVTAGEQHGALAGGEYVEIEVATNEGVELLGPGTYTGTVTFQNGTTGSVQMRLLTLIIESPIRIVPDGLEAEVFEGYWKGPFETPSVTREFTLYNDSGSDLSYTVSATQPWLVVEPVDGPEDLSGTLDAFGAVGFECSVGPIAETLGVGRHEGALRFSFIDTSNGNVSGSTDRSVVLMIEEPIAVFEPADPWEVGPNLDPDAPDALAAQSYTISNRAADVIEVSVLADQDWIDLDATFLQVFPGTDQERTVTASLNPNALALPDGVYESSITFEDTITGAILCRSVVLNIEEDVSLRPLNGLVAAGVVGAAANPSFKVFTLTNVARDGGGELLWEAYVCSQEAQWVLIDGAFASGGSLQDGESRTVIVSIDAVATGALEDGVHTADVCFRVVPDGEEHVRPVSLRLSVPTRSVADGVVPAESMQPEGPDYAYRVAQFHTTNAEYVAFLNDAILHPTDERGQHVYVDASNGDVYVNTSTTGEIGVDDGRRTVKLFSPSISGQIEYAGGAYGVASAADDYADHPVTGVSWYGAVKYCNWLTIDQGMPASERCYTEDVSTEPAGWHPVSTTGTDWLNRDLLDAERFRLVTECEGYRLPMDNGHNNLSSALDSADGFNEWYKAAAWSDLLDQNTTYGFGRSSITGQDANFRGSGDPWDEGTTPAGYFDGTDHGGTFETNPLGNANAFGLFDLTGNVFHWMQGRYNAHPDSIDFRTIRGGSWGDSFDSPDLRNDRRTFIPADATSAIVGFRVVRSLAGPDGDVDGDGDVDVVDFAASRICLNGPEVGYVPGCASLDLDDDVDVDLRDVGAFQLIFAGAR